MIAIFDSLETNPLLLDSKWEKSCEDYKTWSGEATVKIFNNEEEYNHYRECKWKT